MADSETGPWTCDTCGEPIQTVKDGYVQWIEIRRPNGTAGGRGLHLVHHLPASPRGPDGTCEFDNQAECARDHGTVKDLPLEYYVGADGLIRLLEMLSDGRLPTEEVLTLIQRLHVHGYEQARPHFAAAIDDGVFEPNAKAGYYRVSEIQKVLNWVRERTSESE